MCALSLSLLPPPPPTKPDTFSDAILCVAKDLDSSLASLPVGKIKSAHDPIQFSAAFLILGFLLSLSQWRLHLLCG